MEFNPKVLKFFFDYLISRKIKLALVLDKAQLFLLFFLFCSYNIVSFLLDQFGLAIEYEKTEVFYFSRSYGVFNPPLLDLSSIGGLILTLKTIWQYLGFIFNRKLIFCQHIDFYTNKALSTVKSMKILGNSTYRLLPYQKCLLYRNCILPIVLYGFSL